MQRARRSNIILYVSLMSLLGFGTHYYFSGSVLLEHVSSYILYPILVAQHALIKPVKTYLEQKRSLQEFQTLIDVLQAERDELVAQNVQLNAMLNYTDEIKELVEFKKQFDSTDAIVAQVLVKHFSDQLHYFLIDKGAQAGIQPDMVAVYKNCLLGKVVEVYPQYCKVLLITDASCKVAAYCAHTQASGIHVGTNNEAAAGLRYVSHLADVAMGDLVFSSGDGLVFPKGFALGKIRSYASAGLFYDIAVEPLIDLHKIDYCFIIQKGAKLSAQVDQTVIVQCEEHEKLVAEQKKSVTTATRLLCVTTADDSPDFDDVMLKTATASSGSDQTQDSHSQQVCRVDAQEPLLEDRTGAVLRQSSADVFSSNGDGIEAQPSCALCMSHSSSSEERSE